MNRACPSCPDGYVWTREGPTGKACPTCKGKRTSRMTMKMTARARLTPWANISRTMSDKEAFDMSDRPEGVRMSDREVFDAWYEKQSPYQLSREKAWAAWQAALASQQKPSMSDRELLLYALGEMKHFCVLDRAVRKIEAALDAQQKAEPVQYGCHIDIESMPEGFKLDACVIDLGRMDDCRYAQKYGVDARNYCGKWKPIRINHDRYR